MKIEMSLVYDGVFENESGIVHLLKDEGTGLRVEVPLDLLPRALSREAGDFRDQSAGEGLPVTMIVSWPG